MSHSSWDYSSRIIPTRYESRFHDSDFWRPRWEVTPVHHTPMHHTPMHHTPPFPTTSFQTTSFPSTSFPSLPPPPPEFSSSLVHYPSRDRQMGDFDNEMKRMNAEMGKMFNSMQKFTPPTNVDDWRLSENFRMENPIQNYGDGTRKFQLQFDMRQFKPEEINVKTSGNTLTVQAKHDEKDPNKSVFREYNRSYVLPKDVQPERLTSKLTITSPPKLFSSKSIHANFLSSRSGSSISYTVHLSVPGLQKSPLSEPIPLPQEPKSSTQRDDWRLWVGNLDLRVTEYSLLKILQKFGSLEKFDFLYHKVGPDAGKPRGYCFVSYDNQKDAEKAMKALNGKLALSKRLAVRWAHKLEDDDVRVKDNSRDVDKTTEELSTEAKIKAIEAKLRHMDRSKEEISLTSKPVAAPGTSKYSSTQQMHGIQSHKQHSKPYMRKERKT